MANRQTYTTSATYIDPSTDPGFKILFGRESSANVLIDLLNSLLGIDKDPIKTVRYLDKEKTKESPSERTMAFDIHCETDNGKRFIVEMQNISQEWFVGRCLTYGSRAITSQSKAGKWDYFYYPVISIAFTNFTIPRFDGQVIADGSIVDSYSGKLLTDRLRLIFIQLPQFNKTDPEDCLTAVDEWIFTIKNMKNMENIPFTDKRPIFKQVDSLARMENLSLEDRCEYEKELKAYWDYYSTMKYVRKEGMAEGERKSAVEIAGRLKELGSLGIEEIARIARLPIELVAQL